MKNNKKKLSKQIFELLNKPTDSFLQNVCYSYRHDFGLLNEEQQKHIMFDAKEYIRAVYNNLSYHLEK